VSCLNYDTQQIVKFRGTWQFVTGTCTGGDGLAGQWACCGRWSSICGLLHCLIQGDEVTRLTVMRLLITSSAVGEELGGPVQSVLHKAPQFCPSLCTTLYTPDECVSAGSAYIYSDTGYTPSDPGKDMHWASSCSLASALACLVK